MLAYSPAIRAQAPSHGLEDMRLVTQAPTGGSWLTALRSWIEAINDHRPGVQDPALWQVAFSSEDDLERVRTDFLALVAAEARAGSRRTPPGPIVYRDSTLTYDQLRQILGLSEEEAGHGNANRILYRAAILYADVAMIALLGTTSRIGCSSTATVLAKDGTHFGAGCIVFHWTQARSLLDAVRPNPAEDRFVRLWYRATIAFLLEAGDYSGADRQIEHGTVLLPDDPAILFEHGLYHEGFAAPSIQRVASASGADRRGPTVHLWEAEEFYRKAIKADPGFIEARVHRGRVLSTLGRHRDAADELRLAAGTPQGPWLRYFTEMFLGHEEESLGNRSAARDHYAGAAGLYPQAQSPRLALALLARGSGDQAGALEAMRQLLSLPKARDANSDPWWAYPLMQSEDAKALLAALYGPFLSGGAR
jgi:tetratricopeptide (TPR) repeat protein